MKITKKQDWINDRISFFQCSAKEAIEGFINDVKQSLIKIDDNNIVYEEGCDPYRLHANLINNLF